MLQIGRMKNRWHGISLIKCCTLYLFLFFSHFWVNKFLSIRIFFLIVNLFLFLKSPLQQIKALLQKVGSSFCPDHSDWYDSHSRNADRSVLTKFLQVHPADYSTAKLQVRLLSALPFFHMYSLCIFKLPEIEPWITTKNGLHELQPPIFSYFTQ